MMVEGGKFPWGNGKFPGLTESSPGYRGIKFYETFGDFGFSMPARMEVLRVYGSTLSPFSAWQILQGIESLHVRMERHCADTRKVAQFLQDDPRVGWVNYPGSSDHPQHGQVHKQMRSVDGLPGASGLIAFGVREARTAAATRCRRAARHGAHVGGDRAHRRHALGHRPGAGGGRCTVILPRPMPT